MKHSSKKLSAPCRLHFGMFALEDDVRSFGGLGVMIQEPRIQVLVEPADEFQIVGTHADRAGDCAERWFENQLRFASQCGLPGTGEELFDALNQRKLAIRIDAPDLHVGLGVGTQLAMAIGASLHSYFALDMPGASELAMSLGRGKRSSVGSYGFGLGGLIVDGGREPNSAFPDLSGRFAIPDQWRFVLIHADVKHEIFGSEESDAFNNLDAAYRSTRDELVSLANDQIIPAVIDGDFDRFNGALGRFNRMSGELFAATQGGAFHGQTIERIVAEIQGAGFDGVGQSSWGPTLFVAARSEAEAELIRNIAAEIIKPLGGSASITPADNAGYRFERLDVLV